MKTFLSATEMSENACISLRQISSYVQGKTEGTFWIFSILYSSESLDSLYGLSSNQF